MSLKRIRYRTKRTVLYVGNWLLSGLSRSPGCAQCGTLRPEDRCRLCASLPREYEADLVSMTAPPPSWPDFRRRWTAAVPAPDVGESGATPERLDSVLLRHPALPPEALLHRIPGLADHYVLLPPDAGSPAVPADFFSPNGIPLLHVRPASPAEAPEVSGERIPGLWAWLGHGGGRALPGFAPDGRGLPMTREAGAELEKVLGEASGLPPLEVSDYIFLAAHWMLAFGRAVPVGERKP